MCLIKCSLTGCKKDFLRAPPRPATPRRTPPCPASRPQGPTGMITAHLKEEGTNLVFDPDRRKYN